jgi:hypothetical protein
MLLSAALGVLAGVAPLDLVRSADYLMNRPIAAFAVGNVGLFRAIGQLGHLIDARIVADC